MIEFLPLPDDHPDLAASPMLRGTRHILRCALEHEDIGLTAPKAFKRDFAHWAVENFEWPGQSSEEMFRYQRVVNKVDFQPFELLHFLLIRLQLSRHYKVRFLATNDGRIYAGQPGVLFEKLVPFFLLTTDHAVYYRYEETLT